MNLKQAIQRAREILTAHNIEDAPLESELLLRHALNLSQVQLYQDFNKELSPEQEKMFWELVERRRNGEPSAYITGHREFYGLDFLVDARVLIPRPESELLVERALALPRHHPVSVVAEIGTGCGAIAISLALNRPQIKIYATDISVSALEVARLNCQRQGVAGSINLLEGDMLDTLPEPVDLIIANLPYVKEAELSPLADFEPRLALSGGADGLEKIRRLAAQLSEKLRPGGTLLLEIGQGQGKVITTLFQSHFPSAEITVIPDLSGIERVVSLTTK